ncbi:hypothetical protein L207DRAFT_641590 [Hyaloscypha variabilis F]|uniref:WW domain-containing protein n=1 Tax=Hyaloscypha variabilis (strain UAMH 11265 / GT02V1 / F) TaxID=1149755 RepID=A0A2J6QWN2_HYAVF|nr:hypothetical protein L207DRAFT_641590 [Hyaloscypha variabilis F]
MGLQSITVHTSSEPYKYTPLDDDKQEIRLLVLLPGQFSAEIRACLEVAKFTNDQTPTFEAISYAWGSTDNPVNIFIGQPGNSTLSVTQNLAEGLPYFRFEDRPRVLWVDAICVDQQNLKERGHQVKKMADIYSKAARVLIWLGPESQNSTRALLNLEHFASKVKVNWQNYELSATTEEVHWADQSMAMPLLEEDWLALYHFIHRPWFERLWIRQEVYLASRDPILICGRQMIPWKSICNAVISLTSKPSSTASNELIGPLHNRLDFVFNLCDGRKGLELSELIHRTKFCMCSDQRDRVYSLLSLLPTATALGIEPDYSKSVNTVYRDTTISMIETAKSSNLNILTTIESDEQRRRVPSWTPDAETLRHMATFALSLEYPLHEHQLKAFCRTITINELRERYSPPAQTLPSLSQSEEAVKILLESSPVSEDDYWKNSSLNSLVALTTALCRGRSFFLTQEGKFGLGPHNTRPDDFIAVLLGCRSPLVLRTCSEGGYEVVSEAYCDGFMDGEALLGPFPHHFAPRNRYDGTTSWYWAYLDQETGLLQAEDPRLGPLPPGWSLRSHLSEEFWQWIVNDETGEEAFPDPRLTSESLRKRGVPLEEFVLI